MFVFGNSLPGHSVTVFLDGVEIGTVSANADTGAWSLDRTDSSLADGVYLFSASATDADGNSSAISDSYQVMVDGVGELPVVAGVSEDTGRSGTDGVTSDRALEVRGTAEAGAEVVVFRDGAEAGRATAGADGAWSLALAEALADGAYAFTAEQVDLAGNRSAVSAALAATVDGAAPARPAVTGIFQDTGASNADGISRDNTQFVIGTAEAGSTVAVYQDGAFVGTAQANATTGAWRFDHTTTVLPDATYAFTARTADRAGNLSAESGAYFATIDTGATAPVIGGISTDTGLSGTDGVTSDRTLAVRGTAEAGASIAVLRNGASVGTAVAGADGSWTLNLGATALADGSYDFRARQTDRAGNISVSSETFAVRIDTGAPGTPAITGVSPDSGGGADGITATGELTLTGTAEAGAQVRLFDGGLQIGIATADGGGTWTLELDAPLAEGPHSLTVVAVDRAGNASAVSGAFAVTVDGTAPEAPVLAGIDADSGLSGSDGVTNDRTLVLRGTAEAGAEVTVSLNGEAIGTARADAEGRWEFDYGATAVLPDGTYTLNAVAEDEAGNTSAASAVFTVVVDGAAAGTPAFDGALVGDTLTLTGTAEAGSTVAVTLNGVPVGTALADPEGGWSFRQDGVVLPGESYVVGASAADAAGNASATAGMGRLAVAPDADASAAIELDLAAFGPGVALTADGSALGDTFRGGARGDRLLGGEGDDLLEGRGGDDTLEGGEGDDTLAGGAGAETLAGGTGDDVYVLDEDADAIVEAGGTDEVRAAFDYALGAGLVNLTLTGTAVAGTGNALDNRVAGNGGDNSLAGGGGADTLEGGGGADTLEGGEGIDSLAGGDGDDVFLVDEAGDVAEERADGGLDEVRASVSYTLGEHVERLVLTGAAANGTGNAQDNAIVGTGAANALSGAAGDDTLEGGAGRDSLAGGAGDDALRGGAGVDEAAYGGGAADYDIVRNDDGTVTITDLVGGAARDGTDLLDGVERLRFADGSTVYLTPNNAPTAVPVAEQAGTEDTPFEFSLPEGAFSDADGDAFTLAATLADGSALPSWISFDPATLRFVGTPPADLNGLVELAVMATDSEGSATVLPVALRIAAVNDAATGGAAVVGTARQGEPLTADVSSVGDPDGIPAFAYQWQVADAAAPGGWRDIAGATAAEFRPRQAEVGQALRVVVSWTDGDGSAESLVSGSTAAVENVDDAPDSLLLDLEGSVAENDPGAVVGTLSATDPDSGDGLTFSVAGDARFEVADGNVLKLRDGVALDHEDGPVELAVTVTDPQGLSRTETFTIPVADVNDAPVVAEGIDGQTVAEDEPWAFEIPAGTFADQDAGAVLTYTATLADGTPLPAWLDLDGATGRFAGTPPADFNGSLALRVKATDAAGASAETGFTLAVTSVNDVPYIGTPAAPAVDENAPAGTVLAYYYLWSDDPRSGAPSVTGAAADRLALVAAPDAPQPTPDGIIGFGPPDGFDYADGTPTAYALVNTRPLDYETDANPATGNLAFQIRFSELDGDRIAVGQGVRVRDVNDAPTGPATAALAAGTEDTAYTVSAAALLAGFSDQDRDTLSVSGLAASNGTVADNGDGTFTVTPAADYNGAVTLGYSVVDGRGGTVAATRSFTLAAVNDAPRGAPAAVLPGGTEDAAYTVSAAALLAGFSDPEGGALSVSGLAASNGTVADNGDGTFTVTPAADYNGAVTLNYSVVDGSGGSIAATQGFTLAAVNDAPRGSPTAALPAGAEDTAYRVPAAALLAGFSDPDGDALSVSGLLANRGTVVDNGDGTFTVTPNADYNGAVVLGYSVADGTGRSIAAGQQFTLAAVNDGPRGSVSISGTPAQGQVLTASNNLSDPEGMGTVTYQWLRAGAAITGATGATYTLAQADVGQAINVRASYADGLGQAESATSGLVLASAAVTGGTANDTLNGSASGEYMVGRGGNDSLAGAAGNDSIFGDALEDASNTFTLTPLAESYLTTAGNTLVNGLGDVTGGTAGFGENVLARNDDGSSAAINIASVFGAAGLDLFGTAYTSLYINNNGNLTFANALSDFTPTSISGGGTPIIAPFWADVDTRGGTATATAGGTSRGTNQVFYDLDATNKVLTVTWDDVGYYSSAKDKLNAFQLQLINRGGGDFDIVFRYEDVNWTTGSASGGSGGLGGTPARAGFTAGNGTAYYELPQSGNQASVLGLETTAGNSGRTGVWVFEVRNGGIVVAGNDTIDGGAGQDELAGGPGNDTFVMRLGEADGDTITDFNGNGASVGDQIQFVGYGTAAAGATFQRVDATTWEVRSSDGLVQERITIFNGAGIDASDYVFA